MCDVLVWMHISRRFQIWQWKFKCYKFRKSSKISTVICFHIPWGEGYRTGMLIFKNCMISYSLCNNSNIDQNQKKKHTTILSLPDLKLVLTWLLICNGTENTWGYLSTNITLPFTITVLNRVYTQNFKRVIWHKKVCFHSVPPVAHCTRKVTHLTHSDVSFDTFKSWKWVTVIH